MKFVDASIIYEILVDTFSVAELLRQTYICLCDCAVEKCSGKKVEEKVVKKFSTFATVFFLLLFSTLYSALVS